MSSDNDEIPIDQVQGPIRMTVRDRLANNGVGIGFMWKPDYSITNDTWMADLSQLVFKRVRWDSMESLGSDYAREVLVSSDHLDGPARSLIYFSGNHDVYEVSAAERKAVKAHIDDLRKMVETLKAQNAELVGKI